MNELTNERTNERTNARTDGRTDGRTNERASERASERTNERTNERMNQFYNLYLARETRGSSPGVYYPTVDGQAQGYILRRSLVINPLGNDSPDVGNYSTSREVRT